VRILVGIGVPLFLAAVLGAPARQAPLGSAAPAITDPAARADARPPSSRVSVDEFVGPFPSWANLKTTYHAVGDGTADDSAALQAALDALGSDERPPVLFIPSGTYRITRSLALNFQLGVGVVGEDPDRTRIVWDGPPGVPMLFVRGVAYSRISRLTFDGRGKASAAVEQTWDNKRGQFDTGNEYADDRFLDVQYGIRGGFEGYGFAETSVVRARFIRNRTAGIALGNFNALDLWVWDSLFEDCGAGVTNEPGAGNFRVYDSVFRRSTVADLVMQNTGGFTARGNYSIGSNAFWISGTPINHPATIDIQDNVILDTRSAVAIKLANQGPGLIMDNRIRSLPNTGGPVVSWSSLFGSDVISIGNAFTVANAVSANGRLVTLDDRIVTRPAIADDEPVLPPAEPSLGRKVFDVQPGASAAAIQQAIDAAVRDGGVRPIVHLPYGQYAIDRTIAVPASDVMIVGDGYLRTTLRWSGTGRGPVLQLQGPTRATLTEIRIDGGGSADGIVAADLDRAGSRAHLEGVQLRAAMESNLLVDAVHQADVQLVDFGHAYMRRGTSVRIAGDGRDAGPSSPPNVVIYSGASSGNHLTYDVSGGASLLARDIWYEGSAEDGFARVHDNGAFALQGARVATPRGWTPPAFLVDANAARFVLLTTLFDDRIVMRGPGARAAILGLANMREENTMPALTATDGSQSNVLMLNLRQRVKATGLIPRGTVPVPDRGTMNGDFVRTMLRETRSVKRPLLDPVPAGAADLRLFRVWAENGANNVVLRGAR
jgi:hypothetical protein